MPPVTAINCDRLHRHSHCQARALVWTGHHRDLSSHALDSLAHGGQTQVTPPARAARVKSPAVIGHRQDQTFTHTGQLYLDLTGMSVMEAALLIRGPVGTAVTILIERDGETFEVEIKRDVIKIDSVRGEILDDNLAYVRLSHFGTRTTQELEDVLAELLVEKPDGLILDLRRNPGGALDTVVDIADEFLPKGTVLIQEFANGVEREFKATNKGDAEEIPLVVLIDEGSASASRYSPL